jgi:DNA-binding PadR family transcriptional regulator
MERLPAIQRDLLFILADEEGLHGLEIKEELEDFYQKEVHHGRLYPNLDTLVQKGLADKSQYDQRTSYYIVTSKGKQKLLDILEWQGRQYQREED